MVQRSAVQGQGSRRGQASRRSWRKNEVDTGTSRPGDYKKQGRGDRTGEAKKRGVGHLKREWAKDVVSRCSNGILWRRREGKKNPIMGRLDSPRLPLFAAAGAGWPSCVVGRVYGLWEASLSREVQGVGSLGSLYRTREPSQGSHQGRRRPERARRRILRGAALGCALRGCRAAASQPARPW